MSDQLIPESDTLSGCPHPRYAKQIIGQNIAIERFLAATKSERILHAWLITGPQGVGKATLAWKIAKFLMMRNHVNRSGGSIEALTNNIETDANHPIIHRICALSEPSLSVVRRQYDVNRKRFKMQIGVEDIRTLGDQFSLTPPDGQPLIAIIDSADDMNNFAANALLKLLEEPPSNSYMFLISHFPNKLLPTIRSRCGYLRCEPLESSELKQAIELTQTYQINDPVALAELSGGSVGNAIQLKANEGIEIYRHLIQIISNAPGFNRESAFKMASDCGGRGAETFYVTTVNSILLFLSRLTKAATGFELNEAVAGEHNCIARLGSHQSPEIWSALNSTLANQSQQAMLVNLDPVSVVLDMLFAIDKTVADGAR